MTSKIAFVGGGNMATSLIGGLIKAGHSATAILVAEPSPERRSYLQQQFQVQTTDSNHDVATADAMVLAVKPQVMQTVLSELSPALVQHKPLLISVAAGLRIHTLQRWASGYLNNNAQNQSDNLPAETLPIVRCMPNTPSLVGAGASGLFANEATTDAQRNVAESLLRGSGLALWVQTEKDLDAVTALSGSGPAYYFAFMEAMQNAGEQLGLPAKTARLLTLETAFGAAKMALESNDDPGELRRKVTSPNGTTEQALNVFNANGLNNIVQQAMQAAAQRADSLATELDQ